MSLCVTMMDENKIIIAADSRMNYCNNENIDVVVSDDIEKLRIIDNMIVFFSGEYFAGNYILETFQRSNDKSIENLFNIIEKFTKKYPANSDFLMDFTVVAIVDEKPTLYNIKNTNLEKGIDKIVIKNGEVVATATGYHKDKAMEIFNELTRDTNECRPISTIKQIFSGVASQEVGGKLTVYQMKKDRITLLVNKELIPDSKPIKRGEIVNE